MLGKMSEEEMKELGPLGALLMAVAAASERGEGNDHRSATNEEEELMRKFAVEHPNEHPSTGFMDRELADAFTDLMSKQVWFLMNPTTRPQMCENSKVRKDAVTKFEDLLHAKMAAGTVTNTDLLLGSAVGDFLEAFNDFSDHMLGASLADVIGKKPEKDGNGRWSVNICNG